MSKKKQQAVKPAAGQKQATGPMTPNEIVGEINAILKQKAEFIAAANNAMANAQQCDGAIKAYEVMLNRLMAQETASK